MGGHSKGVVKAEFCAIRKSKCDHAEYQKNCVPKPTGWDKPYFWQGKTDIKQKKFEAHHLLCVACVTQHIANGKGIVSIVKQTKWCINEKPNMFAMPLWGHTLKFYCRLEVRGLGIEARTKKRAKIPKFKNIPQHDYDHNSSKGYKSEIDYDLAQLASQIRRGKKKKHEARVKDIKAELKSLSRKHKASLRARGKRCGGTDKAWKKGKKKVTSNWYEPFSMAATGCIDKRVFPSSAGGTIANKIRSLVTSYLKGGG